MQFKMSEENSKKVLSGTKLLTNAGQNYFASLNNNSAKPTSSVKKIVNALLLVPIIVPAAITALSIGFIMLFLNAIDAQKDDSTLSKVAKGTARLLIYIAAALILIPCVILNLAISLIPGIILYYINQDIFNQKSTNIENNQGQEVNEVKVNGDKEYNERIEEEVGKLGTDQQRNDEEQDQPDIDSYVLVNSGQYNQPTVEVISRKVEGGGQAIDQTVIAKRINSDGIRDGKAMIRTVGDDRRVTMNGIITGNAPEQQKGFATCFRLQCDLVQGGLDLNFDLSTRTGKNQQEATQTLMQSESARTMLSSGNGGILSIEHPGSSQRNSID